MDNHGTIGRVEPPTLLFFRLTRQRRLVACVSVALFVLLAIGIQALPRSYKATASVMVDSHPPRPAISGVQVVSTGLVPFTEDEIGTEMAVIHSHALLSTVVTRLQLEKDEHFNPHLNPGMIDHWRASVRSLIDRYLRPGKAEQGPDAELSDTIESLSSKVKVTPVPRSRVIEITASAWNAGLAAQIANTITDLYISERLGLAHSMNRNAQDYLTRRLAELKDASSTAARAVEQYRAQHGLALGATSTLLQEQMTALSNQLLAAQAKQSAASAAFKSSQGRNPEELASVLDSPTMARLRELEASTASKRADLVSKYGARSPVLIPLDSMLANTRRQIADEARRRVKALAAEVGADTADVANLTKQTDQLQQRLQEMEVARAHLETLQAQSTAALNLYTTLLNRAKETDVDLLFPATDVRVVSNASVPTHPAFPNNLYMLPGAALLSFGLGALLGIVVDTRRKGLLNSHEVESLLGLPTLAMVPIRNARTEHLYRDAIEHLLNWLHFGLNARSVLVTSSLPQEGKSMTARALANAAAARGWRVLLVDADMRSVLSRPKTDATVVGLAEVLRGELDVIHAMRQTSNSALTILPAGRLRDNPIRLLSMKPAQTVFESLADRFDLVIVDGPPVMAGGDCWMLAQHVDQTILISEWAETSPTAIRTALRHLAPPRAAADQRAPVEVAGIVLNQVDPRKSQRIDDSDSIIFSTAAEYYPGAR